MKKIFLLAAASVFLFSCKKDDNKSRSFKSQEVAVNNGKTWSTVKLNKSGAPEQIMITLNDAALNTVITGSNTGDGHQQHGNDIIVPLHKKGLEATPFQFFMLNWNPSGHGPTGIYDKPHFDIHLYMTPTAEVMSYTDMAKMEKLPDAAYLPTNHLAGDGVPMMGKHWVDLASSEFNGKPFTQTFIYGSYDSKVVFYEPMITLDFLKNTQNFERPIPQPSKFQKAGYYPTKLRLVKHDGVTDVIFDGLTYRQAS